MQKRLVLFVRWLIKHRIGVNPIWVSKTKIMCRPKGYRDWVHPKSTVFYAAARYISQGSMHEAKEFLNNYYEKIGRMPATRWTAKSISCLSSKAIPTAICFSKNTSLYIIDEIEALAANYIEAGSEVRLHLIPNWYGRILLGAEHYQKLKKISSK